MDKGEDRRKYYDELKNRMLSCAKLRPKLWENPPYTMVELREGQVECGPYIRVLDPIQFNDPEMKKIAETAVADHNPDWKLSKVENATVELLTFGKLFDFSLQVTDNFGMKRSICKAVWRGSCMRIHSTKTQQQPDQIFPKKNLSFDEELINEFQLLARSEVREAGYDFVEFLDCKETGKRNKGFFTFADYLLSYTGRPRTTSCESESESESESEALMFMSNVSHAKWLITLDDIKADFFRFRARMSAQVILGINLGRGDCSSSFVLAPNPNRPLSDLDINSPLFETLAMLFIEIHNYENCDNLIFDRVVSASIEKQCEIVYHLEIEAKTQWDNYSIVTEMRRVTCTSLLRTESSIKRRPLTESRISTNGRKQRASSVRSVRSNSSSNMRNTKG